MESKRIHDLLHDLKAWPAGEHVVSVQTALDGDDARNLKVCLRVAEAMGIGTAQVIRMLVVYGLECLTTVFSEILTDCMDGRYDFLSDLIESDDAAAALVDRMKDQLAGVGR